MTSIDVRSDIASEHYTGIHLTASKEEQLPEALLPIFKPLEHARREAQKHRERGVPVTEVVIEVAGKKEELTFDELEERYKDQA